ncbi:hypothetical protein Ddc_12241 [Ditylenchus destructor]|nr:hypothetical protein Ddc_12241 [Ditylenchus destructor]
MDYLPYLNLSEAIVTFIFHVVNFVTMSKIVYHRWFEKHKYPRVKSLSPMVMIFMLAHIICSVMNMPYYSYVILKWSEAHDPNIVYGYRFWLGIPVANYFVVIPALVFFLTLERCLSLKLPVLYGRRIYKWIAFFATVVTILVYIGSTAISLLSFPIDNNQTKECIAFSCTMIKMRSIVQYACKLSFCTANFLLTLYFLRLMRATAFESDIKDSIVKFTLITEICLNLLPGYFGAVFIAVTGQNSVQYFGLYPGMLCGMDAAFCGIYYLKVLSKKNNGLFT